MEENQIFDRKSINISPKDLAISIVAFANADGGDIAIGITDRTRRIEGIDFETKKLNELLRVKSWLLRVKSWLLRVKSCLFKI